MFHVEHSPSPETAGLHLPLAGGTHFIQEPGTSMFHVEQSVLRFRTPSQRGPTCPETLTPRAVTEDCGEEAAVPRLVLCLRAFGCATVPRGTLRCAYSRATFHEDRDLFSKQEPQ